MLVKEAAPPRHLHILPNSPLSRELQTISDESEELARSVGSEKIVQEHVLLVLSRQPTVATIFEAHGIGTLALMQRFGVSTGGATRAGSIETDREVRDILASANRDRRGDAFDLTKAAFTHPSRRLIFYLQLAGDLNPAHPGNFFEELNRAELMHRTQPTTPPRTA